MPEDTIEQKLEQIEEWLEQGRTDAWIAHQLSITGEELASFKVAHGLAEAEEPEAEPQVEGDVLVSDGEKSAEEDVAADVDAAEAALDPQIYEATFDHGVREGYGLWLDPEIVKDPTYKEHWAGKKAVKVSFKPDEIVIKPE